MRPDHNAAGVRGVRREGQIDAVGTRRTARRLRLNVRNLEILLECAAQMQPQLRPVLSARIEGEARKPRDALEALVFDGKRAARGFLPAQRSDAERARQADQRDQDKQAPAEALDDPGTPLKTHVFPDWELAAGEFIHASVLRLRTHV